MKILAFDIATRTGVAFGETGGDPRAWTVELRRRATKANQAEGYAEMLSLAAGSIEELDPDLVVGEAAIGGKQANQTLIKLVGCLEGVAYDRRVNCKIIHNATIRKHFLGKDYQKRDFPHLSAGAARAAIKDLVIHRCRILGWGVEDDNQADACALWDYACAQFGNAQVQPLGELFAEGRA